MNTCNVTITSKNQITLPVEYVKDLRLTQRRVLRAELRKGKIVLTPEPALGDVMKRFWGRHSAKKPLTDAELKRAVRMASAKRAAKN